MEPLNQEERNSAFLKFLLMFIVTVFVVVLAIFFDVKIPKQENKVLAEENMRLRSQIQTQEEILVMMDSVKLNLDRMNDPASDFSTLDARVARDLAAMLKYENDSSTLGRLMRNVNVAYASLKNEKKRIREAGGTADKTIDDLKDELKDAKEELKDCEKDKMDLMMRSTK